MGDALLILSIAYFTYLDTSTLSISKHHLCLHLLSTASCSDTSHLSLQDERLYRVSQLHHHHSSNHGELHPGSCCPRSCSVSSDHSYIVYQADSSVWGNIKAAMPDRIVFILFAVLMIQFGTAVLVRSVRLSKANS